MDSGGKANDRRARRWSPRRPRYGVHVPLSFRATTCTRTGRLRTARAVRWSYSRGTMRRREALVGLARSSAVLVSLVGLASCEAVPDLEFEPDAALDVRADARDGTTADAEASDGHRGRDGSCGNLLRAGATCCGDRPCFGKYCDALCGDCMLKCDSPKVCCATMPHLTCRASTDAAAQCP